MPCANCYRYGRECIIAKRSKRCRECIDRKVQCSGNDFASALARNIEEEQGLGAEEEDLTDEWLQITGKLSELQTRILAVRRRRKNLRERGKELFGRGIVEFEKNNPAPAPSASAPAAFSSLDPALLGFSSPTPSFFNWTGDVPQLTESPQAPAAGSTTGP